MQERGPALEVNLGNAASELGVCRGSLLNLVGNEGEMAGNFLTCPLQSSPLCSTNPESTVFSSCVFPGLGVRCGAVGLASQLLVKAVGLAFVMV